MKRIYFHADDYGVSEAQSARILNCYTDGVLNSMSVIPNTPELEASLALLDTKDTKNKIRRVLHLNFVEGKPVSGAKQVDMLVDDAGLFSVSFIQLLKWSYCKRGEARIRLKAQLKAEIAAQMEQVVDACDYKITAIDSHQHYHMIPIVLDALLEVIEEKNIRIEEIRIPVDPVWPLLKTPSLWLKVPVINWVKWGILWLHAGRNRKRIEKKNIKVPVFFGIFFTCEMKLNVVNALMPKYISYAQKQGRCLELMFHPGNLIKREELLDMRSKELEEFYTSENRLDEAECLKRLK
ncbi:MAG: ChbG/HpnK family deacetylase [Lachnospiraceae bacterium]|nr:ChbG/HpnK family deacetylase [Lachnospiraceae bacterium]